MEKGLGAKGFWVFSAGGEGSVRKWRGRVVDYAGCEDASVSALYEESVERRDVGGVSHICHENDFRIFVGEG